MHFANLLGLVADCFLQFIDPALELGKSLLEADEGQIVVGAAGFHAIDLSFQLVNAATDSVQAVDHVDQVLWLC